MNREKTSPLGYYTIGIAALFLLGFLLLIVFAAGTYRDTVTGQDQNHQTRALRSYLEICTSSASPEDVTIEESNGTAVLTIRDSGSRFGLRIYQQDGQLREYYGLLEKEIASGSEKKIPRWGRVRSPPAQRSLALA